ncbi:MAG: FKBP-type peptidyl-prolyl cis-trans isomerase [Candidatus Methylacidiphilales bacterium]|nr:FKBP-type peptidyl-prolyl cis-trans isomerase [Candidatus Methylacidiphilales bacterium]
MNRCLILPLFLFSLVSSAFALDEGLQNMVDGKRFMEENGRRQEVKTTASGLQYEILTLGEGAKPKKSDKVLVHYRGTLINGTEFDSSYKRGEPASFGLTQVIKGWTEILQLMPVGSKFRVVIPPGLAYGERGSPPTIGPASTLIFDIELIDIAKPVVPPGSAY